MFKTPSSRRLSKQEEVQINLIPILDALVTLIAFLLFSSSFLAIVAVDTPLPLLAPATEQIEQLKEKPLQLTAYIQADKIIIADWTGSRENHTIPNITNPNNNQLEYDYASFHQKLIEIKSRHPKETKLILKPDSGVSYETLIALMDSARNIEKTDNPIYVTNENGVEVPETKLFPEIIFGNIMQN
jgi:biopolymer transport protein ExbD